MQTKDQIQHKIALGQEVSIREMEAWLRDIGFSKTSAKTLLARGFAGLDSSGDSELSDTITTARDVVKL